MSDPSPAKSSLPPVPTKTVRSVIPPVQPIVVKDPAWWRRGSAPFLVLLMVAAAADLAWPREAGWGIGAGIGCFLAINALLLLRRDFSRGEYWFLQGLAMLNMLALCYSGYFFNWFVSLVLPFFILMYPTKGETYKEPNVRYRTWWSYWVARRNDGEGKKDRFSGLRSMLPMLICILVGVICFIAFLCIFASGNPVVELVWNTITEWWNTLMTYLQLSWDFWIHVLYWIVGIFWFGLYCFARNIMPAAPAPAVPTDKPTGTVMLPHLPLCILIGINAAFAVATSTDIAFLWFGLVPEGISQTTYLHNGADSIIWASVLAACVLVLLFRSSGVARQSPVSCFFGYLLVVQTALLAVSVYMRLYHQIEDYGFTVRRLLAAEAMLMGLAGLIILVLYMATNGSFFKYTKICLGTMLLLLIAFFSYSPARLAGNLNLLYVGSHPHWSFSASDFHIGRFSVADNPAFAEYVCSTIPQDESHQRLKDKLFTVAEQIEKRAAADSWLTFNLALKEDIPTAERVLGRPIQSAPATQQED